VVRNGLRGKLVHRYRIAAVVSALAWTLAVTIPPVGADPAAATALVLKVVDGDTIDIRDDVRGRLRVRLLGIDSPETNKPGYTVGCWGPEATEFAKSTMVGQRVALVPDPTQDRTDRYGRTLAYLVRADGWDYSVEAVRAGAARSYIYGGTSVDRYDAIAAAEREARDAHRGLWRPPCNGHTTSVATVTVAQAAPPPSAPVEPPASTPAPPPALFEPPAPPPAGIVPPASSSVYYDDCGDARAAGDAPLRVGEPGYRSGLDRDGDGVACEG
jgi:endonuclease YncB( thermonuclease family)